MALALNLFGYGCATIGLYLITGNIVASVLVTVGFQALILWGTIK